MEEINEIKFDQETEDTKLQDIKIPVKFNKQQTEIPLSEASAFIQKGMKYDMISDDFLRLKNLAVLSGKAVGDYIINLENEEKDKKYNKILSECGGNEEIARRIIELEGDGAQHNYNIKEVSEYFPDITGIDSLPEEVLEASEISGGNLLNCYLRYLLKEERDKQKLHSQKCIAENCAIGTQSSNEAFGYDAAASQFLKGIWGK